VRIRAFGNYSYRVADPKLVFTELSGTRERYTVDDADGQLRGLMLQHISDAVAGSGIPFLDLASNQVEFAEQLKTATAPAFEQLGLRLEIVTMQSVSLPEELQKVLDQRIGMGMVGTTWASSCNSRPGRRSRPWRRAPARAGAAAAGASSAMRSASAPVSRSAR
jgi:membrane protease subunit (stomatin/prohibitin family)